MSQLTIEVPEEILANLKAVASSQTKTVEQIVLEQLSQLQKSPPGSLEAVRKMMRDMPPVSEEAANEFLAAIKAGRTSSEPVSFE